MSEPVHAACVLYSEYTLCGDAFDLGENPDERDPVFANSGDLVTCTKCREVIAYCKSIKRWRTP